MSGDYLVLAWSEDSGEAGMAARLAGQGLRQLAWGVAHEAAGLQVWVRDAHRLSVTPLAGLKAVLIGQCWPRLASQPAPPSQCGARDPQALRAAQMTSAYWGRYVAVLTDPGAASWALRDPSGAIDALSWSCGPLTMVSSTLEDLPAGLLPHDLALDWDAISSLVKGQPWAAGHIPLRGVEQIAPGEVRRIGDRGRGPQVWRPLDWVGADAGPESGWARRLRETVDETIKALASSYDVLVAEVSGGLDSAVVASSLVASGAGPRLRAALHLYGDRPESDEQAWAAEVCDRLDIPMRAFGRAMAPFDPEMDFAPLARDARPPISALDSWRDTVVAGLLRSYDAQALFTGMGGDAVFFQTPMAAVFTDLLQEEGLRALFSHGHRDVARRLRRSVWSVALEAIKTACAPPDEPRLSPLIGERARLASPGPVHPWLERLDRVSPARRAQIVSLAGLQDSLGRNRRTQSADIVHPLLAQPVLEVCLMLPTWSQVVGGRDRSLARDAFADRLPRSVVFRRSKGELTSLFSRRAAASLDLLRPFLLDGVLVSAKVLDRGAVDAALRRESLIQRPDALTLISAAAVEAWVRYWQGRVPDAPSADRRQPR